MDKLASQIIVDIIQNQMALPATDVWVDELNYIIPTGEDIKVSVGMSDATVMSSGDSELEFRDPDTYEIQQVQMRENIQIEIFARSASALLRRWEVVAALNSIYSEQQQEFYGFKIFSIPNSFINTSVAEGGSQLARFTLSFACFVWYRKERLLTTGGKQYYDTFKTRVDDEKTIGTPTGLIEFTIDENTEL
ncbi:MAG: hypothetical protein COB09_19165 [Thalassobium sp.]|nr:MAG: hypothetical protein COB09_19165 [Thalassobium sp.]